MIRGIQSTFALVDASSPCASRIRLAASSTAMTSVRSAALQTWLTIRRAVSIDPPARFAKPWRIWRKRAGVSLPFANASSGLTGRQRQHGHPRDRLIDLRAGVIRRGLRRRGRALYRDRLHLDRLRHAATPTR